jgi:hypothetical protein
MKEKRAPQINVSPYAENRHYRRAASDGWRELKAKKRIEHQKLLDRQWLEKQKRIAAKAEARRKKPTPELGASKAEKARIANEAKQQKRAARHAKYMAKHAE